MEITVISWIGSLRHIFKAVLIQSKKYSAQDHYEWNFFKGKNKAINKYSFVQNSVISKHLEMSEARMKTPNE